jgi:hypothetical protein
MNNRKAHFIILLALHIAGFLLISCKEDKEEETVATQLTVDTEELSFFAKSDVQTLTLTCNAAWSIEAVDWLNITPKRGGEGEHQIMVMTADHVVGEPDRAGFIRISSGDATARVNVIQSGIDLSLSRTSIQFVDEGGTEEQSLDITCSEAWTATIDGDWATLSPDNGAAGETTRVIITAVENTSAAPRAVTMRIQAGEYTKTIAVEQDKTVRFTLSSTTFSFIAVGNVTRQFILSASSPWRVTAKDSWININPSEGLAGTMPVTVSATDNAAAVARNGSVTFEMDGYPNPLQLSVAQQAFQDNYEDGDYIMLHTHTTGSGVPLVIIGDGFDHEDLLVGGYWETEMRKLANLFLDMPVVRDHQNYFDIYLYMAKSTQRGVTAGTNNKFGSGGSVNWNLVDQLVNTVASRSTSRTIIFVGNGNIGGYALGDRAIFSTVEGNKPYWMIHEYVGHILGRMPDLYCTCGNCAINDNVRRNLDDYHAEGLGWMVDYTNDPEKVIWKDFLNREGYEKVGFYPSSYYGACTGGIWSPEPINETCMNTRTACFSVAERYQLWKRIMTISGELTGDDIDGFFVYDASREPRSCNLSVFNSLNW